MITIEAEFRMSVPNIGRTYCRSDKDIFNNPRDIESVEEAIKYAKRILTKDSSVVTFTYFIDTTISVSRIFWDWKNGKTYARVIKWDKKGNAITDEYHDKLTTKLIRELYLECADKYLEAKELETA